MEDLYVKPGNQERGWNDPPQFSYGLQTARGPHKTLLNKRAGPQSNSGTGAPPSTPPSFNPLAPPPRGVAPPPFNPAPPPGSSATPPRLQAPIRDQREASQSDSRPDAEVVLSVLNVALAACRGTVRDQVCKDMEKRLRILEDSWRTGRLSEPVQRRMDSLCHELQMGRWDSADEIHRSLMVDHVTEVSQWMVGVKRLIAETRNLSPELLETLQNLKRTVQDPVEPVQDSTKPVQDPVESVQDSPIPVQDPMEPVQDSTKPVQDPVESVQDSPIPVQDPMEPIQDSPKPVQDPMEPIQDSTKPVQDPMEPIQDSPKPVQDSVEEPQVPVLQS